MTYKRSYRLNEASVQPVSLYSSKAASRRHSLFICRLKAGIATAKAATV